MVGRPAVADARMAANHMMIDHVDHECTKVVYSTLETTLPRIQRDWVELTPIRSQETTDVAVRCGVD